MTQRRRVLAILVLSLALCVAGCGRKPPSTRPTEGGSLTPEWSVTLPAAFGVQVVASPGGFVVSTPSGELMKILAVDGSSVWKTDLAGAIAGAIVTGTGGAGDAEGDVAAVPLAGGEIAVVSLSSGAVLRRIATGWDGATLAVARDRILAITGEGSIRLYSVGSSAPTWESRLPGAPSAPATVCAGRLMVGLDDGRIVGVDLSTGEMRTRKNLGAKVLVAPTCSGNTLYAATADNQLHALRLYRRRVAHRWSIRMGGDPAAAAGTYKGDVLLPSKDTFLYAFHQRNGHLVFRARLDRRPGPPAILDDLLFVAGPQSTRLDAFRLPEGRGAGSFSLPEAARFISAPVASSGRVAIALARYGEGTSRVVGLGPGAPPKPPGAPAPKTN